jgi:hypothetical protein
VFFSANLSLSDNLFPVASGALSSSETTHDRKYPTYVLFVWGSEPLILWPPDCGQFPSLVLRGKLLATAIRLGCGGVPVTSDP